MFRQSQKDKDILCHRGYEYRKDKVAETKVYWRCTKISRNFHCSGRAVTLRTNNEIVKISDHCHGPSPATGEARQVTSNIRKRAFETAESPTRIVHDQLRGISMEVAGVLPPTKNLTRTVTRRRRQVLNLHAAPSSLEELDIPDLYKTTVSGKNFLMFDSGPVLNRILIFATEDNLKFMEMTPHWHMDGTFKVTPPLFTQLYTIHGVLVNSVIPTVYCLLPHKNEAIYESFFTNLLNKGYNLNPTSITIDFEKAVYNAIKKCFPNAQIYGCLFHFGQCLWRRIQNERPVRELYESDVHFSLEIRKLIALAYVPAVDIPDAFNNLTQSPFYEQHSLLLRDILDYYEDTWIGRSQFGRRREALFPLTMWSVYDRIHLGLPRTNNSVEGWHHRFNRLLDINRPNLYKFLETLKSEENFNSVQIIHHLRGDEIIQKKKYKDLTRRLVTCVARYNQIPIQEYLTSIAVNITI